MFWNRGVSVMLMSTVDKRHFLLKLRKRKSFGYFTSTTLTLAIAEQLLLESEETGFWYYYVWLRLLFLALYRNLKNRGCSMYSSELTLPCLSLFSSIFYYIWIHSFYLWHLLTETYFALALCAVIYINP